MIGEFEPVDVRGRKVDKPAGVNERQVLNQRVLMIGEFEPEGVNDREVLNQRVFIIDKC